MAGGRAFLSALDERLLEACDDSEAIRPYQVQLDGSSTPVGETETSLPPSPNLRHPANFAALTNSTTSDAETSIAPSPIPGPPANFKKVAPGIYRSSFPRGPNFDYLSSLSVKLKTILSLVAEEDPDEVDEFATKHRINHLRVLIQPLKEECDIIPQIVMDRALDIILDESNHPILVHCNKGKHRTGCVIGCYRKITGWKHEDIVKEYVRFAGAKARERDQKYIQGFDYHWLDDEQHHFPTPPSSDKGVGDPPAPGGPIFKLL